MAKTDPAPEVDASVNVKPAYMCPRAGCCRAGDDLGQCGSHRSKCPPPQVMIPGKAVLIVCEPCNKTFGVTAEQIVKQRNPLHPCSQDVCCARVVQPPKVSAALSKPKAPKVFGRSSEGAPDPVKQNIERAKKR